MKRNYLIALAIFSVLLLGVLFQLYAHETPLEKAARILEDRKGNLRDAIADLDRVVPTMDNAEQNWITMRRTSQRTVLTMPLLTSGDLGVRC